MTRNDALLFAALLGATGQKATSKNDREDVEGARELRKLMKDLEAKIRSDMPELSQKAVERTAELSLGITMALGEDCVSQVMMETAINKMMEVLVAANIEWAVHFVEILHKTKIKPAYDNAVRAGVDPVVVFQANFQMSLETAQKAVADIRADETSGLDLSKGK
jgi:hypothetical protein